MARRIRPKKPLARRTGKNSNGRPFHPFAIGLRSRFFSGRGTPSKPCVLTPCTLERHRQRQLTETEALCLARKTFSHQLRSLERPDVTQIKPILPCWTKGEHQNNNLQVRLWVTRASSIKVQAHEAHEAEAIVGVVGCTN